MEYLIVFLPIISIMFFMVILEKPAYIAGPISFAITLLISIFYYGMDISWVNASMVRGGMLSLDIMLIIVGVFLLITILKKSNAFYVIRVLTHKISSDWRVQMIFLSWFVVSFLEGVAGFGTPSMIVAPILITLGFSPLSAVVASLIGDGVASTFGAAGTPILIGIMDGISSSQIQTLGPNFLAKVATLTSFFHLLVGFMVPLFILCIVGYIQEKSIKKALQAWKLAIVSGVLFLLPSFVVNYYLGPEFPSILGSIIGILLFVWIVKMKIFLPIDKLIIEKDVNFLANKDKKLDIDYLRVFVPYLVALFLLIISRMNINSIGDFLKTIKISMVNIFGTGIGYNLYPLYSPGFFFMIAAIIAFYIYKINEKSAETIATEVSKKITKTFIALVSILSIVQIIINSGNNSFGHAGMLDQMSSLFVATGGMWPLLSPFLGLFGAFLAGSSTVSNLMFSSIQVNTALTLSMSPILALALQGVGSAVGNMFAIHNVIAVGAVAHLLHSEGKVIKYTIIPALFISLLVGMLGLGVAFILQ